MSKIIDRYGFEIKEGDTVYIDVKCKGAPINNWDGIVIREYDDEHGETEDENGKLYNLSVKSESGHQIDLIHHMPREIIKINTIDRNGIPLCVRDYKNSSFYPMEIMEAIDHVNKYNNANTDKSRREEIQD